MKKYSHIDIVLGDDPAGGPESHFIEIEDEKGNSIRLDEWLKREDGLWAIRITEEQFDAAMDAADGFDRT